MFLGGILLNETFGKAKVSENYHQESAVPSTAAAVLVPYSRSEKQKAGKLNLLPPEPESSVTAQLYRSSTVWLHDYERASVLPKRSSEDVRNDVFLLRSLMDQRSRFLDLNGLQEASL